MKRILLGMAAGVLLLAACAPSVSPATPSRAGADVSPRPQAAQPAFGEYLGYLDYGPYVWRFRDGDTVCYVTKYNNSGGISCVKDRTP